MHQKLDVQGLTPVPCDVKTSEINYPKFDVHGKKFERSHTIVCTEQTQCFNIDTIKFCCCASEIQIRMHSNSTVRMAMYNSIRFSLLQFVRNFTYIIENNY
jgi:hypothetical protein